MREAHHPWIYSLGYTGLYWRWWDYNNGGILDNEGDYYNDDGDDDYNSVSQ